MESWMERAIQLPSLPVPVPPMLEEACGYSGQARYVAFYWGEGNEVYYSDGFTTATGDGGGYLMFAWHESVAPCLKGFKFGSSEEPAKHWLLLDREQRQLYAVSVDVCQHRLSHQWVKTPQEMVLVTDHEAWDELLGQVRSCVNVISQEQVHRLMQKHQQIVRDMSSWLDQQAIAAGATR